jgi:hypothetical protein
VSLALRDNKEEWPAEDYHVMHGELRIGRIWHSPTMSWSWIMGGVFCDPSANICQAGVGATLADAKAALTTEWDKWLAWAELSETPDKPDTSVGPAPNDLSGPLGGEISTDEAALRSGYIVQLAPEAGQTAAGPD